MPGPSAHPTGEVSAGSPHSAAVSLLCLQQLCLLSQDLPQEFSCSRAASLNSFCSFSGEEVALYCAKYLPEIIKDQKAYKEGKLQKVRSQLCPRLSQCQHRGRPLCQHPAGCGFCRELMESPSLELSRACLAESWVSLLELWVLEQGKPWVPASCSRAVVTVCQLEETGLAGWHPVGKGQLPTRGFAHTQALEDAFLAIDAKLTTEEVIKELSQMAGRPQDDEDEKEKVADEDDGESDATAQTRLQLQDRDVEQQGRVSLGTRFSVPVPQLNFG